MARFPDSWQEEAIDTLSPLVGSESRVRIVLGPPETSIDGTVLEGVLDLGEGDEVMIIHDRSGRPDVYPWHLLAGPVLRVELLRPGRRKSVLFEHPTWTRRGETSA